MDRENLTPEERELLDSINAPTPEEADAPVGDPSSFAHNNWPGADKGKSTPKISNAAGFYKKNKAMIWGGTSGLAIAGSIALFFFWLMLFKNVHIKNLYVTYRWAQFNRGITRSLKQELTKAKEAGKTPRGNADTTISENATPAEAIEKANINEVGADKLDPANDVDIDKAAKEASSTQQSIEGSSQEALKGLDVERTVKPAANAEEAAKNVADDIADAGTSDELKPKGKLSEGAEDAKKLEEGGKSAKAAANEAADTIIKGGGSGFAEAVQKATGPFVIATFYCIFRDIYVEAKKEINQIMLGGASTVAQEVNKTADCQKLGQCSLDQAGAVANKFDDGKETASVTCGWKYAEGSDTTGCVKIDPKYTINALSDRVGGTGGDAIQIADQTLDIKSYKVGPVSVGPKEFCPTIMNSWVQGGVAIANFAAIVASGGSWGAAGEAVATGVGAAAATAGGKALIAHAILTYSGGLFKELSPHDMGNLTDMGNLAAASATCKAAGCVKATPKQAAMLNQEYRQEKIAKNKNRSVLAKFFDTQSSDSVLVRTALNTPTTPKAVVGRIGTMFASMTNPLKLNATLGKTSLAFSGGTAMAADALDNNPYGIGEYVPANVLYDISAEEADSFYDGLSGEAKSNLESIYNKCNNMEQEAFIEDLGDQNVPTDCTGADYQKYAAAKFNQKTVFAWSIAHNNQVNIKGSSNAASTSGTSGKPTTAKEGVDTSDPTKYPCPSGATRTIGETIQKVKIGLCDIGGGIKVNASAADAFNRMKIKAAQAGFTLTGGGYRDYNQQVELRKQHCGTSYAQIYEVSANACKPPTARPGSSMHEEGLAVDFDMTSGLFEWFKANANEFGIFNLPSERWHWSTTGG